VVADWSQRKENPMQTSARLFVIISTLILALILSADNASARKWDIKADSVFLADTNLSRPYQIKEIVSFKIKRQLAEESAKEARERLKKTAAERGCDAVIFVDHYTERDPTELTTNAILVQSLDSSEIMEREKKYKSPETVLDKVKGKQIMLSEKDIEYPYEVKGVLDVIVPDGGANTTSAVDGLLTDAALDKRSHAVIFIQYDRARTEVNGARGVAVRFPKKWLDSGAGQ
jgi:hypothetical protein